MSPYLTLPIAIVAEVIATSALKSAKNFTVPLPSLMVVAGYAVAFYFLSLTVEMMAVGVVYAIWAGLGIVLVSAAGWIWYGERLDAAAIVGQACIILGVVIINLLSKTARH